MLLREIEIDGTRAVAFATKGGLAFAVLVDRSLDVGALLWRGEHVGWIGPAKFRHPAGHDPHADDGRGFNRLFSGFLVTGGLEHIRQPASGHPLHGSLPFTPADLASIGINGERRAADIEMVKARLALADGTVVRQGTRRRLGPLKVPDAALGSVSYPVADGGAECTVVTPSVEITFTWTGETLPHLQLWGDLSSDRGVLSIEPCTSERLDGGLSGEEPPLAPGERRRYALQISLAGQATGNAR